jgi:hypothetical protein
MNANHNPDVSEREMLRAAANVCATDPHCLGYAWYIWETEREHERDLSVWGNNARVALFQNPPTASPPEREREPAGVLAFRRELRQMFAGSGLSREEQRREVRLLLGELEA